MLARPFIRPAILSVASLVALLAPLTGETGAYLWAASLVLFGMPHGAYDVAVVAAGVRRHGRRAALRTAAIYTLVTALGVAALLIAPGATVVAFLALSAHHFGVSDCVWTRGRPARVARDHLLGLTHGVAVLSVPFIAAPDAAWAPFVAIAEACGGSLAIDPQLTRAVTAGSWAIAALLQSIHAVMSRDVHRATEQLGVLAGAALLGWFAPPLTAVAVYFLVVHASGHCLRATAPGDPIAQPGVANAWRVHLRSAPLLIPSVAIVAAIALAVFGELTIRTLALGFLLFCVVGTAPHHLLWLDLIGPERAGTERGASRAH